MDAPGTTGPDVDTEDAVGNVLVLAPPTDPSVEDGCASRIAPASGRERAAIVVSMTGTPERCLSDLAGANGPLPPEIYLICVGDQMRAGKVGYSSQGQRRSLDGDTGVTVDTVTSATNLTKLGIRITERLEEAAGLDGHGTVTFCFQTLSPLLVYNDFSTVFKFLHTLTSRLARVGVKAQFNIDPAAHDDKQIAALKQLFDAVREPSPDVGF